MKNRFVFYLFVAALVVLDSVLLRSPNVLGKIGLIIYKYHYLRTFPKTLLTVSCVVGVAVFIGEIVRWLVRNGTLKRTVSLAIFLILIVAASAVVAKTGIDFSSWTYSHTGSRFKYGAYLLPCILILIFVYHLITLPKAVQPVDVVETTTSEKM
ncbi:hypothetical protein [Pseudochryseolinea flava]|uniref:Uncharacterized protein n=1 Tax=Pseudochryseolinea flava TaxID=2059302 RepID=A0A364XWZ8_9BACT|nr:hypothetical protein [Pseudochryseolinea flava]RAV98800.1 hypothetical protein DQQ10_22555 [Pseudochryseolinea flava]